MTVSQLCGCFSIRKDNSLKQHMSECVKFNVPLHTFQWRIFPANHLAMVLTKHTDNTVSKIKHKKPEQLNITKPNYPRFSRLLWYPARKWIGSILTINSSQRHMIQHRVIYSASCTVWRNNEKSLLVIGNSFPCWYNLRFPLWHHNDTSVWNALAIFTFNATKLYQNWKGERAVWYSRV